MCCVTYQRVCSTSMRQRADIQRAPTSAVILDSTIRLSVEMTRGAAAGRGRRASASHRDAAVDVRTQRSTPRPRCQLSRRADDLGRRICRRARRVSTTTPSRLPARTVDDDSARRFEHPGGVLGASSRAALECSPGQRAVCRTVQHVLTSSYRRRWVRCSVERDLRRR